MGDKKAPKKGKETEAEKTLRLALDHDASDWSKISEPAPGHEPKGGK